MHSWTTWFALHATTPLRAPGLMAICQGSARAELTLLIVVVRHPTRAAHGHMRFVSKPLTTYCTKTTRPPVTVRAHQVRASAPLRAPGRQFGNGEKGAFCDAVGDVAPTMVSQSAARA